MTVGQMVTGGRRRLAGVWQESLYRTGHLLVANSVLTAGVGIGYWLLAARMYPPGVVGVNSAAISAMMLLAAAAQLNLMSALLRFVPTAGAAAGRLIRGSYLVGGALSAVAAVVFLAGLRWWAPALRVLLRPGPAAIGFVVATVFWALFDMQDNVLVAVKRSLAVPLENLGFAALKILLIVVLAAAVPAAGIWLSWTAAMAVMVLGTSGYLFWRALPSFTRASAARTTQVASLREIGRFVGPDYVGSLAWIAATSVVPLLVLDLTNPRISAVFALAWSICSALYQVPIAFGQSLVAHGVLHTDRLPDYHRRALGHTLRLLVPVVAVTVVAAPLGLSIFGSWYGGNGAATLRLLALSALPNAVVSLEVSRARVVRRMTTVVVVLVALSVLVLGLTLLLVPHLGIAGGGVAWLAAQSIVAGALLVRGRGTRWLPGLIRVNAGGVPRPVIRSAMATGDWRSERTLVTVSDTAVIMVSARQGPPRVLKVAATPSGVASLWREAEVLARLRSDERLGSWRDMLPVPLRAGSTAGGSFLLTTRLPGQTLASALAPASTAAAIEAIGPLHRLGHSVRPVDGPLLEKWVDEPIARISRAFGWNDGGPGRLAAMLRGGLEGRRVALGWTHGDYYPGNLLVGSEGVSGIVDWGQAREQDLVLMDLVFWLLTMPAAGQPRAFGARVAAGLDRSWASAEARLLEVAAEGDPVSRKTLLLLVWLRHVADDLAKSGRYAGSPVWARRNVVPVLRQVGHG